MAYQRDVSQHPDDAEIVHLPTALTDAAPRTAQTINAIENGKSDPSLPLAFAMARLFGRAIEEIFDDGVAGG